MWARRRAAALVGAAFALSAPAIVPAPALANDSTAELATGGLVPVKNAAVAMRSERLSISAAEIRVRYVFFNTGGSDVTATVAFPLPDVTISGPDDSIAIPDADSENLLGFATEVDGRTVTAQIEQKAIAKGADQSALLRRLGIPLAPYLPATQAALDRLPRSEAGQLVRLGLAEIEEYDDTGTGMKQHPAPRWTAKTTYYWQQRFPAQRELVVEHHYRPSVGSNARTALGEPGWQDLAEYRRKYCIDDAFMAAVLRARARAHNTYGAPFTEERIDYILVTGANWAGPIGDFTLTVDKGAPQNLVSFCGDGIAKTSPTRFQAHKTDFTPSANLSVLILKPTSQ